MPLAKCPRCSKLFDKQQLAVCPRCQPDEEADYDKVREALEAVPTLNAEEVSVETGVEVSVVSRMVDQGLIANVSLEPQDVKCGVCGAPAISLSKKLCRACLERLNAKVALEQAKVKLTEKKDVQVGEFMNARTAFEKKRRK